MCVKNLVAVVLFLVTAMVQVRGEDTSFIFNNGFHSENLTMDGISEINPNGLLQLTNETKLEQAHAFYPNPIVFNDTSSFSTTFVFAIRPEYKTVSSHGIAFVISPQKRLPALANEYLGLFNNTNNGDPKNHVFAVEIDTILSPEFGDINDNHVGIDINNLKSSNSSRAGYYDEGSQFQNLRLISGDPMQVWVEYDGVNKRISVTMAPINVNKPKTPLLTLSHDLSHVIKNPSYVGFSGATCSEITSHYILGWSFKLNGEAQNLVISELPKLPPRLDGRKHSMILEIGLPLLSLCFIFFASSCIVYYIFRKMKFSEIQEEWEEDYGAHRFKYKDLYVATKGFKHKEILGSGGFGRVYKGTMPSSKLEVAVKKVSHDSRQGMREFVAEIVSIGRFRHRNIVPLLGYCRRKRELLLVYDFMPNGSLDKYLHNQPSVTLNWTQRFKIIKGVASGLHYLHEECEKVVVHRDIKASNILLDSELNGRIGDFGLAKLYNHGSDPQTTHVVGTWGYLAPEQTRTGKATTRSDVFAFGAFLLEVACGRRPIEQVNDEECEALVDWVYGLWNRGEIIESKDPNLGTDYLREEVELVLKLGLLCSNFQPLSRPSMRQVVQYLNWEVRLPDISSSFSICSNSPALSFGNRHGFLDSTTSSIPSYKSSSQSSVTESFVSAGF